MQLPLVKRVWERLKKWYEGEYVPHENDPDSPIVLIGGYTKRPWVAYAIDAALKFCTAHRKWLIGTVIALLALTVSIFRG